jgi:peptidoglycan glycosyltransferase
VGGSVVLTLNARLQRVGEAGSQGKGGHRYLPYVAVAGKTGSAENPHGRARAWFRSFAPYERPILAIAVLVGHSCHSPIAATPIARSLYEAAFGPQVGPHRFTIGSENR